MSLKVPKIDDITFDKLLQEAINRISQYSEEWTDHNVHDPGITFIELLAWLTEMQIYYLDQITEKHKLKFLKLLGVTLSPSIPSRVQVTFAHSDEQAFLLDSGTKLKAKVNSDIIPFETIDDIFVVPFNLNKIVIPKEDEEQEEEETQLVDTAFAEVDNKSVFYPFGKKPKNNNALYLGFDRKTMEKMEKKGVDVTIALNLYEDDLPKRGEHDEEPDIIPSSSVNWEYSKGKEWVRLEVITDSTRAFSQNGFVRIMLPLDIAVSMDSELEDFEGKSHLWFRCRLEKAGFEIPPRIKSLRLNTVNAVQMRRIEDEVLENKSAFLNVNNTTTALPNQLFSFKHSPIVPRRLVVKVKEKSKWREWDLVKDLENSQIDQEHYMLFSEKERDKIKFKIKFGGRKTGKAPPKGIDNVMVVSYVHDQPCEQEVFSSEGTPNQIFELKKVPPIPKNLRLTMIEKDDEREEIWEREIWNEVFDFDSSKPEDSHYTLKQKEGLIQLGSGERGRISPGNEVVGVLYYFGGGEKGNVQKGTINEFAESFKDQNNIQVRNFDCAFGGRRAETLEEAILRSLMDLKERYQAVTLEDFEYIAKNTPGLRVARSKALRKDDKIEVIVVPCMPPWEKQPVKILSEGFKKTVCRHLDRHRLLTTKIEVIDPEYIEVSVNITVKKSPREDPKTVQERVREKLEVFLHPLTRYSGSGWPFGRWVYRSEICAEVEKLDGVERVLDLFLSNHENLIDESGNIKVPKNALVFSGTHKIQVVEPDEPCEE